MAVPQSGRNQLKDLLNDLVLQTAEENRDSSPLEVDEDVEEAARELLEYSSPRKIHSAPLMKHRKTRKRSQRNSSANEVSYIDDDAQLSCSNDPIVIYGRHLNPTRLSSDPSLYSIGREWVRNDPYGHQQHTNYSNSESNTESNLYSLPHPDNSNHVMDSSTNHSPNSTPYIDLPKMDESLRVGVPDVQFHSLKEEHLKAWKQFRHRHRKAYHKNQAVYSKTIQALQEMYHS